MTSSGSEHARFPVSHVVGLMALLGRKGFSSTRLYVGVPKGTPKVRHWRDLKYDFKLPVHEQKPTERR